MLKTYGWLVVVRDQIFVGFRVSRVQTALLTGLAPTDAAFIGLEPNRINLA